MEIFSFIKDHLVGQKDWSFLLVKNTVIFNEINIGEIYFARELKERAESPA